MTIFVSQRANRDPYPWVWAPWPDGILGEPWRTDDPTRIIKTRGAWTWDPRPEYTQTRDRYPWVTHAGHRFKTREDAVAMLGEKYEPRFDPRHDEFDPPVNGWLAGMRDDVESFTQDAGGYSVQAHAEYWLECITGWSDEDNHARRVLTLLTKIGE